MIKVFSRANEYDASRDALAWVLGIALWEVRTARTRERRRKEEPSAPGDFAAHPDARPSPEALAIAHDLELALGCAIGALGQRDADTLMAYARGERPPVAAATFRKRVERALGRLRGTWKGTHGAQ
jgi:RNA polymerase sigma-70 factor (ECF subfamily)